MMELPEAITIAKQMNDAVVGKRVRRVLPPSKAHKFCWYAGDPAEYDATEALFCQPRGSASSRKWRLITENGCASTTGLTRGS